MVKGGPEFAKRLPRFLRHEDIPNDTFTPRTYQVELLDAALRRNTLICLGSNSSKPFISLMVIKELSHKIRREFSNGGKRTVYLVVSELAAEVEWQILQHHTDLTVGKYATSSGTDDWSSEQWVAELRDKNILVMVADVFIKVLEEQHIPVSCLNLVVFDDCHLAVDNHYYVQIMKYLTLEEDGPQILGLTASVLSSGCNDPYQLNDAITNIETVLHSRAETSMLVISERYGSRPKEVLFECESSEPLEVTLRLKSILESALLFLYELQFSEEDYGKRDPISVPKNALSECHNILLRLGPWCAARIADMLVTQIEKYEKSESNPFSKRLLRFTCTQLRYLTKVFDQAFTPDYVVDEFLEYTSPKVVQLVATLRKYKPDLDFMIISNDESGLSDGSDMSDDSMDLSDSDDEENSPSAKSPKQIHIAVKRSSEGLETPAISNILGSDDKKLVGIVFVEQRYVAFALNKLIEEVCGWDENLCFIKTSHLTGSGWKAGKMKDSRAFRKQEETLRKFRMQELNMLISTSVLEEGVDVPKCNLVIRFDAPKDYRSYALSKGRARARDAEYIILVEKEQIATFKDDLKIFKGIEKVLIGDGRGRKDLAEEEDDLDPDIVVDMLPPYCPSENPLAVKVSMQTSIALVNRYCAKLPSDAFTHLTPHCSVTPVTDSDPAQFIATLRLPVNSSIKEEITGVLMPSKKLAKMAVALKMCEMLHKAGELDENLMPVGKEMFVYEEEEEEWEEEDVTGQARPGTTKRKQYYYKKAADAFVKSHVFSDTPCYLYYINLQLTGPITDEQNTRGRRIYAPEDTGQSLGILSAKEIPLVPSFPVYTRSGEVTVSVDLIRPDLILDGDKLTKLERFHQFVFTSVLHLEKDPMEFCKSGAEVGYLIVPLDRDEQSIGGFGIEWDFVNLVDSHAKPEKKNVFDKKRDTFEFRQDDFSDAVVMPSYRNIDQPQHFYVAEIRFDLNPKSPFPSPELYKTFNEYYTTKYGLIITNFEQPLLDVDHTSARLNLLTPRYMNQKGVALPTSSAETKRARRENLQQKQILVPELCDIHVFPASLWRKAVCLPAVLYRMNYLLLAEEIRKRIAQETGIGVVELPGEFRFPELDFGFETNPEKLRVDAEEEGKVGEDSGECIDVGEDKSDAAAPDTSSYPEQKSFEDKGEMSSDSDSGIASAGSEVSMADLAARSKCDGSDMSSRKPSRASRASAASVDSTDNKQALSDVTSEDTSVDSLVCTASSTVGAKTSIESATNNTVTAKTSTESATTSTVTAKISTESSTIGTESATNNTVTATISTESATNNTVTATISTETSKTSTVTAKTSTVTAKNSKVTAKTSTESATTGTGANICEGSGVSDTVGSGGICEKDVCVKSSPTSTLGCEKKNYSAISKPTSNRGCEEKHNSATVTSDSICEVKDSSKPQNNSMQIESERCRSEKTSNRGLGESQDASDCPEDSRCSKLKHATANHSTNTTEATENTQTCPVASSSLTKSPESNIIHDQTPPESSERCSQSSSAHSSQEISQQSLHNCTKVYSSSAKSQVDKTSSVSEAKDVSSSNKSDKTSSVSEAKDVSSSNKSDKTSSVSEAKDVSSSNKSDKTSSVSEAKDVSSSNKSDKTSSVSEAKDVSSSNKSDKTSSVSEAKDVSSSNKSDKTSSVSEAKDVCRHPTPVQSQIDDTYLCSNKSQNTKKSISDHVPSPGSPDISTTTTTTKSAEDEESCSSLTHRINPAQNSDAIAQSSPVQSDLSLEPSSVTNASEEISSSLPEPQGWDEADARSLQQPRQQQDCDSSHCDNHLDNQADADFGVWSNPVSKPADADSESVSDEGEVDEASLKPNICLDEDRDLSTFVGPSPCLILQALTMSNANDFFSLERLETIGDSFLKYAITVYLYCSYPGIHEGKLSYLRSKQVSNYNLYRLGRKKRLAECMVSAKFEPYENWLPPGYIINETRRRGPVPKVVIANTGKKGGNNPAKRLVESESTKCEEDGGNQNSEKTSICTRLNGVRRRDNSDSMQSTKQQMSPTKMSNSELKPQKSPTKSFQNSKSQDESSRESPTRKHGNVFENITIDTDDPSKRKARKDDCCDGKTDDERLKFIQELEEIDLIQEADKIDDMTDISQLMVPYSLQSHHGIPDKSVADCVEALIGCYLTTCGKKAALMFMSWLGLKVLPKKNRLEGVKRKEGQQVSEHEFEELQCPRSPLLLSGHVTPTVMLEHLLDGYDVFEARIGYTFTDRSYLLQAFTHASYHYNTITDCYQRLEFLGDAILDYVITRHLYEDSQKYSPGILTDLRSALVNNNIFAALAVKWDFHKYFKSISPALFHVIEKFVARQKDKEDEIDVEDEFQELDEDDEDGGEDTEEEVELEIPKALGDIFESVAGAIYLDSGMSLDTVWGVYYRIMRPQIEKYLKSIPKSPVRELLELEPETAKFEKPERTMEGKIRVTVNVVGKGVFSGIGRNYRIAKSAAAKKALRIIRSMQMGSL